MDPIGQATIIPLSTEPQPEVYPVPEPISGSIIPAVQDSAAEAPPVTAPLPKSLLGSIVTVEPPVNRLEPTATLTNEQQERAEKAADAITGGVGAHLLIQEIFSRLQGDAAIEQALDFLSEVSENAGTLEIYEEDENGHDQVARTYYLSNFRKLKPEQIVDIFIELENLKLNPLGEFNLKAALSAITTDPKAAARLFACMYLGQYDRKYRRERVTEQRIHDMTDLDLEQMAGALLRFFTERGLSREGVIRMLLKKGLTLLLNSIQIDNAPVTAA